MIIIKNSIKSASANVWRQIVNQNPIGSHSRSALLRRGLHEVSSEGKVSAQGVMGRAK